MIKGFRKVKRNEILEDGTKVYILPRQREDDIKHYLAVYSFGRIVNSEKNPPQSGFAEVYGVRDVLYPYDFAWDMCIPTKSHIEQSVERHSLLVEDK